MKYDIASKVIFERCKLATLKVLCGLNIEEIEEIEDRPQETASLRRSDFVVKAKLKNKKEVLILLEFVVKWQKNLPLRTLEYRCRHKIKENLPVISVILVLLPGGNISEVYKDEEVKYKYKVIKLFEIDAKNIIEKEEMCLYAFVPLMKEGERYYNIAEERIYKSGCSREEKADLLTGMAILAGLKSKEIAKKLIERRRDIMIESAAYEIIKKEGYEEGIKEGIKRGIEKGIEEGIKQGIQQGIQQGLKQGIQQGLLKAMELGLKLKFGIEGLKIYPEIKKIKDVDVLEAISEAIESAQSIEDIRKIYKES